MNVWCVRYVAVVVSLSISSIASASPVGPFTLDAAAGGVFASDAGSLSITDATTAAPVRGCFDPVHLQRDGDAIVLSASMTRTVDAGNIQFRMGLFDRQGQPGTSGYLGYFVGSSANDNAAVVFRRNGLGSTGYWSGTSGGSYLAGSALTTPGTMPAGTYALSLTITRLGATRIRLDYSIVRAGGGYTMVGSLEDRTPQQLAETRSYECVGFFLHGGGFTGSIAIAEIDVHAEPISIPVPAVRPVVLAPLSVMTFNIRYAGNEPANYAWSARRGRVAQLVTEESPDILGVQEALSQQVDHMKADLSAFGYVGVGRNDGVRAGEHAGIFYRTDRFTPFESGSFWLSATPAEPGTTFSTLAGATPRIASWVVLADGVTGRRYFVLNTHWDNQDQGAREQSAALIRERIAQLAAGLPVLLLGDFNTTESTMAVTTLVGTGNTSPPSLIDAFRRVISNATSDERTFQSFTMETNGARIDFILSSPELRATSARIIRTAYGGYLPSDHYPVAVGFDVAIASEDEPSDDDAGMSDAGSEMDAAVAPTDAGVDASAPSDAAAIDEVDAAATDVDAAANDEAPPTMGGACSTGRGRDTYDVLAAFGLALIGLVVGRGARRSA